VVFLSETKDSKITVQNIGWLWKIISKEGYLAEFNVPVVARLHLLEDFPPSTRSTMNGMLVIGYRVLAVHQPLSLHLHGTMWAIMLTRNKCSGFAAVALE
jgi:hypothetical protein